MANRRTSAAARVGSTFVKLNRIAGLRRVRIVAAERAWAPRPAAAAGLDHRLLELVKLRASQINGCAFCIAMHVTDAHKLGEHDLRLHLVRVWREAPILTARERAALALTEAVTELREGEVPDSVYDAARAQFSDAELSSRSPPTFRAS